MGTHGEKTYLGWLPTLELRVVFANQIEVLLVKNLFLLALGFSAPLSLTAFALVRVASPVFLVLVDNKAFADLWEPVSATDLCAQAVMTVFYF